MACPELELEAFGWRLAETIAWCSGRGAALQEYPQSYNANNVLRNSKLRPPTLWQADIDSIVETLARQRAEQLGRERWDTRRYPDSPAANLAGGRLLMYSSYDNLADGAAEAATGGFFDVENEPPWDTWLCFVDNTAHKQESTAKYSSPPDYFLLCWIPPEFIELADRGINVNPEACIRWATDVDTPFIRQLRKAELLK